jgi:hypothetical protein
MAADRKRRLVVWFEQHLQNPPVRLALLAGLPLPPLALLAQAGVLRWRVIAATPGDPVGQATSSGEGHRHARPGAGHQHGAGVYRGRPRRLLSGEGVSVARAVRGDGIGVADTGQAGLGVGACCCLQAPAAGSEPDGRQTRQPAVQGRSLSGLPTTQTCLIRSPATSNAITATVTPSF